MAVTDLTKDNFDSEIKKKKFAIVDFYADWCAPCQMMKPVLKNVSEEFKQILFAKVDVDENHELAVRFGIRSIPCIIIFRDGEEADRLVGYRSEDDLKEKLDGLGS